MLHLVVLGLKAHETTLLKLRRSGYLDRASMGRGWPWNPNYAVIVEERWDSNKINESSIASESSRREEAKGQLISDKPISQSLHRRSRVAMAADGGSSQREVRRQLVQSQLMDCFYFFIFVGFISPLSWFFTKVYQGGLQLIQNK